MTTRRFDPGQHDAAADAGHAAPHSHRLAGVAVAPGPSLRVQPKLRLGPVGDRYEQEADRVAARVVSGLAAPTADGTQPASQIQRFTAVAPSTGTAVPPQVEAGISAARGGGQPLPAGVRSQMEGAMGADFGGVRIHTGAHADTLNQAIQARAFTTGRDVFFARGEYQPGSEGGRGLLAHELAHVVQQQYGGEKTLQRVHIYHRGSSQAGANRALKKELEPSGSGEFGKGLYVWENDEDAALMSALQYHGIDKPWAVTEFLVPDDIYAHYEQLDKNAGKRWIRFAPAKEQNARNPVIEPEEWQGNKYDNRTPSHVVPRRIGVQEFRYINDHLAKYNLEGENQKKEWTQHPMIVGQSAVDYNDQGLMQVLLNGNALDMLKDRQVTVRMKFSGQKIPDNLVTRVRNWKMKDRKNIHRDGELSKLIK